MPSLQRLIFLGTWHREGAFVLWLGCPVHPDTRPVSPPQGLGQGGSWTPRLFPVDFRVVQWVFQLTFNVLYILLLLNF